MTKLAHLNDISSPNIVMAPSPTNRDENIKLYVAPNRLQKYEDNGLNAKIGEYCGLIHGNGGTTANAKGLDASHALFVGTKRPTIDLGIDKRIYVYIMDHPHTYTYEDEDKFDRDHPSEHSYRDKDILSSRRLTAKSKPLASVFATYVLLRAEAERIGETLIPEVDGIIRKWEWIFYDLEDMKLPEDHENRYDNRLWVVRKTL